MARTTISSGLPRDATATSFWVDASCTICASSEGEKIFLLVETSCLIAANFLSQALPNVSCLLKPIHKHSHRLQGELSAIRRIHSICFLQSYCQEVLLVGFLCGLIAITVQLCFPKQVFKFNILILVCFHVMLDGVALSSRVDCLQDTKNVSIQVS